MIGDRPTGPKPVRAERTAVLAEQGKLRVIAGLHHEHLIEEHVVFPDGRHDDLVDALAGAIRHIPKSIYFDAEIFAEANADFERPSPWEII